MVSLSRDDIADAVSRNAFAAARSYCSQGRVLDVSVSEDGERVKAKVQGSSYRPYAQDIHLRAARRGVAVDGNCSCPVGYNCKHVAAALLAYIGSDAVLPMLDMPVSAVAGTSAAPSNGPLQASPQIMSWLATLDNAQSADSEEYPPDMRQRLLYVLSLGRALQGTPALLVAPMSVRLLKTGDFSEKASLFDPQRIYDAQPAKFLRPSDRCILRALAARRSVGLAAGGLTIVGEEGAEMLRGIIATGRGRWGSLQGSALREGPPRPGRIAWQLAGDGTQQPLLETAAGLPTFRLAPGGYVDPATGEIGPVEIDCSPSLASALLAAPPVPAETARIVRAEIARRAPALAAMLPAELAPPQRIDAAPVPHLRLLVAELPKHRSYSWVPRAEAGETERTPVARLSFRYGPLLMPFGPTIQRPIVAHEGRLFALRRNFAREREAAERLRQLRLARVGDIHYAAEREFVEDFMLSPYVAGTSWLDIVGDQVPRFEREGWTVEIADDFPVRLAEAEGEVTAELREGSGIDWFELELGVIIEGERVDLVPALLRFLGSGTLDLPEEGRIFLPLADGRFLPLPLDRIRPILGALMELFRGGAIDEKAARIGFSALGAADLVALENATAETGLVWRGGERLRELGRMLRATGAIPQASVPEGFGASLRPYQARGVDWLQFLRAAEIGGILADDMGLGKTVQALAHLAIEKVSGRMDRPSLVVCPTSLVANWAMEAARFVPDLKVLPLQGKERKSRFGEIAAHDLVITTYPLLSRDHEALAGQAWHLVLLDEAQTIKNPDALASRLVARLEARQRLCLSGTPLENHLGELWSLFAFLSPGFLGDRQSFTRRFRTPIEKRGDTALRRVLAQRVRPFLLRRTKEEVALDLPPKTEIIEHVEMGEGQRAIYESIRLAMHARVRDAIAARGLARSSIVVLDALLKLRQACCDPRLLKLAAARGAKAGSAKLDRLMELLAALIDEGRRILLFSQFTSMLALIEEALDRAGIPRLLLTGDTQDRATPLRRFQAGEVPLFLISLKAGGTGLNLTAADTVIHYDPWWNPAVEEQASSRAHRIGQEKAVFVHKLVTLGTIEEKMDALKARKHDLVAGILDEERGATLAVTEADIEELFAPLAA